MPVDFFLYTFEAIVWKKCVSLNWLSGNDGVSIPARKIYLVLDGIGLLGCSISKGGVSNLAWGQDERDQRGGVPVPSAGWHLRLVGIVLVLWDRNQSNNEGPASEECGGGMWKLAVLSK